MKNFSLILFAIFCFAFLLLGYTHWQDRIAVEPAAATANTPAAQEEEPTEPEEENDITSLISNWPEAAQETFLEAQSNGNTYKLAIVGSTALGTEENGWSLQLTSALEETYGESIEVELFEYDTISIEFINSQDMEEVLTFSPDMVLLEPFSLNDNSRGVAVTDNHDSIEIFLSNLQMSNEDATLILQPANPLYEATYYPSQVEDLKSFADTSGITYLDHWQAWPETNEEELDGYLTQGEPNEKGHEIWAKYLTEYFIAE
ncbi:SGNH/GDSL hydrolase family protein [Rossellomorea vietnamensis]|uniref:SGNH/GDSL hydrolase family protein n=1 Tax=Rossellomorea vietnamensis TaxID=218284 RepID=A0A5D4K5X9_9BACI|nr:SGNH/GDSL hydrolase family protein [Rossellomorea vietnamensis]TYR72632.1 SGNH/GDSL hydrolase family protein [Rossellomorea vietnamensis]